MTNDIGAQFRDLHQRGNPFILANAWDVGSAKMLAGLGAQAIATSSAAHAFTLGRPDGGHVTRDEALAHAQDLVAATNLPVSGDFENGYGDAPEDCAETVRLSAEVGLAGISIRMKISPMAPPTILTSPSTAYAPRPAPHAHCRGISCWLPAPMV